MPNIFQRPRVTLPNGRTVYRYQKIVTGRGIKVGELAPPFNVSHFKKWVKLDAETYSAGQIAGSSGNDGFLRQKDGTKTPTALDVKIDALKA
jgi:hypothetical protein